MRPASRLRSFGSPSHAFGSQLSLIADFLGAAALILFTTWQTATFLQNFEVSAYITLLIILLTALNVIGLLVAIAYQRTVFTITFFFTLVFFSLAPMQQLLNQFDPIMSEPAILSRAFEFCLIFSAFCMAALLVMGSAPRLKNQILRPPSESFPSSACTFLSYCYASRSA